MIILENFLKVVSLDKAALSAASRFIGLPAIKDTLEPGPTAVLMVFDLLHQQKLDKDHIYAMLSEAKEDIINGYKDRSKLIALQILDYKYIALPNWSKPFDFINLEFIAALPSPPIISLCISINAIYDKWILPLDGN